ncbi:crossover junction endodeoxyribonuclease RuvC [Candidatus Collierbacteria bacterium RIFCSPLOWO2_01_FULL_50_23]|uniref:Crossover junction endodeoxyribonuclease RuvC n=2 Tax=Candidatus Collieribacteriota TaxID=1752725 RepID=A0A1F5ERD7_9BACT|nr:MAG: crossover junction endodeoxyribonuclease RuvC [Candidatus Collierbacteria bacterium RIFCSPHIGHO2_02_FULL_49_10]OGD71376.1 MAG: crossover junction endodeoxyribonuclease RuvC [Candidatus Collierbacteria bacterium RIFCSPHIGHO2_01_FULL_50_25]OGD74043.1 MAG: crossover junction endodeoxyribonuclease RuvC [Candidatus Collierbacteria bacterium RIFCSPLOWO2_01_FULL_50_23]
MRVLGIDPGTGRLGWAIVEKEQGREVLVDCGCIETPARTDLSIRLEVIFNELNRIIKEYRPTDASIEDLFFATNRKTVMSVSAARGVVLLTCQLSHLTISSYTPLQIKSTITGYGSADKKQVEFMVKQILKVKELKQIDDTVDAIAAALTHLSFCPARNA